MHTTLLNSNLFYSNLPPTRKTFNQILELLQLEIFAKGMYAIYHLLVEVSHPNIDLVLMPK